MWSYTREPQHADLCVRIIHDHLAGKIPDGASDYSLYT